MSLFNNDLSYAVSRITNSFLMTKGKKLVEPVRVQSNPNNKFDDAVFICHNYNKKGEGSVLVEGNQFLYNLPRLGFIKLNHYNSFGFFKRLPLRRDWRQGLRSSQLVVSYSSCSSLNADYSDTIDDRNFKNNIENVEDCLNNKYPSLESCIENVEEAGGIQAFSKDYAIDKDYNLVYRNIIVGKLLPDDKLKLDPNYEFLIQELSKCVGNEKVSQF